MESALRYPEYEYEYANTRKNNKKKTFQLQKCASAPCGPWLYSFRRQDNCSFFYETIIIMMGTLNFWSYKLFPLNTTLQWGKERRLGHKLLSSSSATIVSRFTIQSNLHLWPPLTTATVPADSPRHVQV